MEPQPGVVRADGFSCNPNRLCKVIPIFATEDPVPSFYFLAGRRVLKLIRVYFTQKDRKDALVIPNSMDEFLVAHRRLDGVRADQEQECIRPFYAAVDLL